jgi:hypothetical protein
MLSFFLSHSSADCTPPLSLSLALSLSLFLSHARTHTEVKKWIVFADKELAVLLFPNLTRNFQESYEARAVFTDVFFFKKRGGGVAYTC